MGLKPTEVAEGYEHALEKALEALEKQTVAEIKDPHDTEQVKKAIRTSVMSKQYGNEDFLTDLIVRACASILPEGNKKRDERVSFNVDNVRVCKILGSGLFQSQVVQVRKITHFNICVLYT
jgi:T-complex protein 1 subunit theta